MVNGVNHTGSPFCQVSPGTAFRPLLFSLYINAITEDIHSKLRFYADDYVCYHEIKGSEDKVKLQEDIVWDIYLGC